MNFEEYLRKNHGWLLGRYLALGHESYAENSACITSLLNEVQLENLKISLFDYMPRNSVILDLWDWDIQFQDDLDIDWLLKSAFGDEESRVEVALELATFFVRKVDEYGMDYDLAEGESNEWVMEEADRFIRDWRHAIATKHGKTPFPIDRESRAVCDSTLLARLKTLDHLAEILECITLQCIGDAKFEWSDVASRLESDPDYQFPQSTEYAARVKLAFNQFVSGNRPDAINELVRINRELWKLALAHENKKPQSC